MKLGVVQFPGSNCDDDAYHAIGSVIGQPVEFIWHQSEKVYGLDAIVLPGGFAYGDYLRTGAIARFSPVMKAVDRFAHSGGLVLGICNGFQILLEAGNFFGLMPDKFNRLADDRADCVAGVVVAIRAWKLDHAELHKSILPHLNKMIFVPKAQI